MKISNSVIKYKVSLNVGNEVHSIQNHGHTLMQCKWVLGSCKDNKEATVLVFFKNLDSMHTNLS